MRYILRQNVWSLGGRHVIRDDNEREVFQVLGKVFSWGDDLSFEDMEGHQLARITQRLMSWKSRYEIHRDGELFAEVVKEWSWFKDHYVLDVPGPNDYTIRGSFSGFEYVFERGGVEVARVSRKFWSLADTYGVEIEDGEDTVAILATCVVISMVQRQAAVAVAVTS